MAQRTAVSAGAIILREIAGELRIALAQHQNSISSNTWVLPKGHVEAGETLEQAALREIYEETGLTNVQLLKHLGSILRESVRENGDLVQKTIHYYLAYAPDTSPDGAMPRPADARFTEVGWFSPRQALVLLPHEQERTFFKEQLAPLFAS